MRALITVINVEEARQALSVGCDILDLKNPDEGSLGAPRPSILAEIAELPRANVLLSVALGDVPNLPCTVALAAVAAARYRPDFLKIGLRGIESAEAVRSLLLLVKEEIQVQSNRTCLVAGGYADYKEVGTIDPFDLPEIVRSIGLDAVLIDTLTKDGRSLFDYYDVEDLAKFVEKCRKLEVSCAMAGSLKSYHLESLFATGVEIVGFRGAVCHGNDRRGSLDPQRVKDLCARIGAGPINRQSLRY